MKDYNPTPETAWQHFVSIWRKKLSFLADTLLLKLFGTLTCVWMLCAALVYYFEKAAPHGNIKSLGDGVWWGIVTLLTVGYGDRFPVTTEGRMVGGMLMMSGVVAIGILTAKISSEFFEQVLRNQRGELMSHKLKDHIVVCGYKDDMSQLLLHVLDFNPKLPPEKLVLMAQLSDETIAAFRAHPRLKDIQVAVGDYAQEVQLKRVMPHFAKKILLLADRAPLMNGALPSVKETDARTLMAAMVLSHLARGVPVSAEILDPSMDSYLRMAGVSEIIHSREYNRLLLANASGSAGLSSIIFSLLDPHNPTVIHVEEIPEALVGATYADLQTHFSGRKNRSVVIGVLENTGNSHRVKEAALRKAQKTSNVEDLVRNLKAVKQMQFNCPVFNPDPHFRIVEGATAIMIETRSEPQELAA